MKKPIICAVCLAFMLAFGFVGALFSQTTGPGSIRGVVVDEETGQPLAGVTIKMYFPELSQYHQPSPVTDKEGRWLARNLRTGMWSLELDKAGYVPQTISWSIGFQGELQTASQKEKEMVTVRLKVIKGVVLKADLVEAAKKSDQLFAEKKYAEARAVIEKVLADSPDVYIFYKNIGNTYFAEENYEKAVEAYLKVYTKDSTRSDVAAAIANAYNNMGKKPEAAEWYAKLAASDIRDVDTAYNAGISLYNAGNPTDAIKYFQKSVEINPAFADGYYQLGMASVASSKNEDALAAFKKFLELAPESPQAGTAKSIMEALTKK